MRWALGQAGPRPHSDRRQLLSSRKAEGEGEGVEQDAGSSGSLSPRARASLGLGAGQMVFAFPTLSSSRGQSLGVAGEEEAGTSILEALQVLAFGSHIILFSEYHGS